MSIINPAHASAPETLASCRLYGIQDNACELPFDLVACGDLLGYD